MKVRFFQLRILEPLIKIYKYIKNLSFDETPNYDFIIDNLIKLSDKNLLKFDWQIEDQVIFKIFKFL